MRFALKWQHLGIYGALQVACLGQIGELQQAAAASELDCCMPPYAFFDCTGNGHAVSPGKLYTCVDTSALTGCMTCLTTVDESVETCSSCCAMESDNECRALESDWEFYASTLFFVCLCCCFSVLCGFTEVRRKKKGVSFAQAWSVPQAMPILRTWPGRSLSASDVLPGGEAEGEHWTPLSDDEDGNKQYPVAGQVDESTMAFAFVTSMPQSLLGSVAASMSQLSSGRNVAPPSPQEPELTVWISRDGAGSSTGPGGVLNTVTAVSAEPPDSRENDERQRNTSRINRTVVVGNNLEEPFIVDNGETPIARVGGGSGGMVVSPLEAENQA